MFWCISYINLLLKHTSFFQIGLESTVYFFYFDSLKSVLNQEK